MCVSYNGMCGIDANRGDEQVITGNLLLSNSRAEKGKYPGIRVQDLTHSIVQGNRCADDQEKPTQLKGIEESGESDYNLIGSNLCVWGWRRAVCCLWEGIAGRRGIWFDPQMNADENVEAD